MAWMVERVTTQTAFQIESYPKLTRGRRDQFVNSFTFVWKCRVEEIFHKTLSTWASWPSPSLLSPDPSSAKLWLGPRLTRNLLETRSWHCWGSLSNWWLLIGRWSPTLASDWPEHGTQILSDKLVQLGPAALTDEGKNCQSRFNFYYTLSYFSLDEIQISTV